MPRDTWLLVALYSVGGLAYAQKSTGPPSQARARAREASPPSARINGSAFNHAQPARRGEINPSARPRFRVQAERSPLRQGAFRALDINVASKNKNTQHTNLSGLSECPQTPPHTQTTVKGKPSSINVARGDARTLPGCVSREERHVCVHRTHAPAAERQVLQGRRPGGRLERLVEALPELERPQSRRPSDTVDRLVELPPFGRGGRASKGRCFSSVLSHIVVGHDKAFLLAIRSTQDTYACKCHSRSPPPLCSVWCIYRTY